MHKVGRGTTLTLVRPLGLYNESVFLSSWDMGITMVALMGTNHSGGEAAFAPPSAT